MTVEGLATQIAVATESTEAHGPECPIESVRTPQSRIPTKFSG